MNKKKKTDCVRIKAELQDQLMKEYKGQVDVEVGENILADHYDVYLKKHNKHCSYLKITFKLIKLINYFKNIF